MTSLPELLVEPGTDDPELIQDHCSLVKGKHMIEVKTGGPGVLWSMGSQRVGHDNNNLIEEQKPALLGGGCSQRMLVVDVRSLCYISKEKKKVEAFWFSLQQAFGHKCYSPML